jgi:hypothetical protein
MRTSIWTKALAVLCAGVGMLVLPVAAIALRNVGPAERVVFYEYLPLAELAGALFAAAVGAALGAGVPRWLRRPADGAPRRLPRMRLAALALLAVWVAWPQLFAFPASADLHARDAWARAHVPRYAALTRVVAALPEVQRDVGPVRAMAPTANDAHRSARTMDGDEMRFTLEVAGERGRGTFNADCTLDESRIYEWRAGRWTFDGHTLAIAKVADRVPPSGSKTN